MNGLKLSLIVSTLLIFTGCGGGGGDSADGAGSIVIGPLTQIASVADAKTSFQSTSALDSVNSASSQNGGNQKQQRTSAYKTTDTYSCTSGTITIIVDGLNETFIANQCSIDDTYMNGTISTVALSDGSEKNTLTNLTIRYGEISLQTASFVDVEHLDEHWYTIDGTISITSACFTGNYEFETIEKLYETADGSAVISGIFELNGARYTFENPNVTIKVGDEEETIPQSELEQRMSNTTTCI